MAADINWNALAPGSGAVSSFSRAYDTGRRQAKERQVENIFRTAADDPRGAANALLAAGAPDRAAQVMSTRNLFREADAQDAAQPYLEKGDYAGASKASAPFNPALARQFASFDQERLERTRKAGERSASVLMAASQLPDPVQRRQFLDSHAEELSGLGYTPEQVASYDTNDATKMRADASRFMDISQLAGKVSVEKFGDFAVTYETNPVTGTRAVSRSEIPMSRTEQRQAERDAAEDRYRQERLGLDRQEFALKQGQAERTGGVNSPGDVTGPVLAKIARGEPLTPGEQQVYDYMRMQRVDPLDAELGGGSPYGGGAGQPPGPSSNGPAPAQPIAGRTNSVPRPPEPRRAPAPAPTASATPPAHVLREGQATTFANGQTWTLRGGRPVRVK